MQSSDCMAGAERGSGGSNKDSYMVPAVVLRMLVWVVVVLVAVERDEYGRAYCADGQREPFLHVVW